MNDEINEFESDEMIIAQRGSNQIRCTVKAFKNVYKEKGFSFVGKAAKTGTARRRVTNNQPPPGQVVSAAEIAEKLAFEATADGASDKTGNVTELDEVYPDNDLPEDLPHREIFLTNKQPTTSLAELSKMKGSHLDALENIGKARRTEVMKYFKENAATIEKLLAG